MEHLFLNSELSLLAREKGFREECLAFWEIFYDSWNNYNMWAGISEISIEEEDVKLFLTLNTLQTYYKNIVAAPTYQQIVDWFLEKYQISIEIEVNPGMYTKYGIIYHCFDKVLERKLMDNITRRNFFVEDEYMEFGKVKYKMYEEAIKEAFKLI